MNESSADVPVSYRWVLERIVLPAALLGFSAWLTFMNVQIADIKRSVATLERQVVTNTTNAVNTTDSLIRIESKLDRLIER